MKHAIRNRSSSAAPFVDLQRLLSMGLIGLLLVLAGCGVADPPKSAPVTVSESVAGVFHGGQQPVSGSSIQLYAISTAGNGSASLPLLSQPVTTNQNGEFTLPTQYTCPSASSIVYLAARGGNPGLAPGTNNAAIGAMAVLGACGSIGATTFVNMNEITTIGSLWPLAAFANSYSSVGYGSASATQFNSAVAKISELTNIGSGTAPGAALPSGATVPTARLNTLASILANCINSAGGSPGDGTVCGTLFQYATVAGSSAPTNTLDAMLAIASNPTLNVANLFYLTPPVAAFQPTLQSVPADWTLPVVTAPVISPAPGTYTASVTASLATATSGAVIHYTTDGTTPTTSSATYSGPFTLSQSTTVNALSLADNMTSSVVSASYTIPVASKLAFVTQPSSTTVGSSISPPITVAVEDVNGNTITTSSAVVTLALAGTTSAAVSGTLTATAVAGIATFNDVTVTLPGTGYQLTASTSGLTSATSTTFAMTALTSAGVSNFWSHPGSSDSPFNTPLTSSEQLAEVPSGFSTLQIDLSSWFSPATSPGIWQAANTDPLVAVLFNQNSWTNVSNGKWLRQGNTPAVEAEILASSSPNWTLTSTFGLSSKYYYQTTSSAGTDWYPPQPPAINPLVAPPTTGLQIHAPAAAIPAQDSDGYFAIFQPDGTVLECYSGIVLSSGTIVCGTYNVTHSWSNLKGTEGGIMASMVPVYAGLIRQAEITAGVIPHALSVLISATQLSNAFTSPAVSFDRSSGYSGTLPMGARIAIPMSVNLSAHTFQSPVGAMIAKAMQNYGAFLLDRGGPNGFTIRSEMNMTSSAFTNAWDWDTQQDLNWILSQLQTVQ